MVKNKINGYTLVTQTLNSFRINAPPNRSYTTVSAEYGYNDIVVGRSKK